MSELTTNAADEPITDLQWADLIEKVMGDFCTTYYDGHSWNADEQAVPIALDIVKRIRRQTVASLKVHLLYEEVSDQYGTDRVAAVFSDREKASAAESLLRKRRSFIKPMPLDPERFDYDR